MKKDISHSPLRNLFLVVPRAVIFAIIVMTAGLFPAGPGHCAPSAGTVLPNPSLMSAHFLDIPYAGVSAAQKLDIYLPKHGEKPYAVVLRIHGDDPKAADKRGRIAAYADPLLKRGYALVSIDYRYSSEDIFTARIYDVKAAVRYIKTVADTYDLNPHRIIAWGESTGATLAALLAVSADVEVLEDLSLGNPDQSSRIQGAVVWSGVFDFLPGDQPLQESRGQAKASTSGSAESKLPGGLVANRVPELAAFMSPATYITIDDPPFLIQHGTEDATVPVQQSIQFAAELEKVLGSEMVFLDELEGAAHVDEVFFSPENMRKVLDFLDAWTG